MARVVEGIRPELDWHQEDVLRGWTMDTLMAYKPVGCLSRANKVCTREPWEALAIGHARRIDGSSPAIYDAPLPLRLLKWRALHCGWWRSDASLTSAVPTTIAMATSPQWQVGSVDAVLFVSHPCIRTNMQAFIPLPNLPGHNPSQCPLSVMRSFSFSGSASMLLPQLHGKHPARLQLLARMTARITKEKEREAEAKRVEALRVEEELLAVCYVCDGGDHSEEDAIVFCERCCVAVHTSCYKAVGVSIAVHSSGFISLLLFSMETFS